MNIGCDDFQGVSTKRLGSPREQAGIGIDFQVDPYGGGLVSEPEAHRIAIRIGHSDGIVVGFVDRRGRDGRGRDHGWPIDESHIDGIRLNGRSTAHIGHTEPDRMEASLVCIGFPIDDSGSSVDGHAIW